MDKIDKRLLYQKIWDTIEKLQCLIDRNHYRTSEKEALVAVEAANALARNVHVLIQVSRELVE